MPSPVLMAPLVVKGKHPPGAAGGDDDRPGAERHHAARPHLDRDHAGAAAVLDDQVGRIIFIEAPDRRIFQRGLEQRVQNMETGLVGGVPGALDLHAAERPHRDRAVGLPAPRTAPVLQLQQFQWRGIDEQLDRVLVAEPVTAGDGVVEMVVQAVIVLDDAGGAAFGGDRVAAHRIDLGDQRQRKGRIGLGHRNSRAQSGAAGPDNRDVDFEHVHAARFPRTARRSDRAPLRICNRPRRGGRGVDLAQHTAP